MMVTVYMKKHAPKQFSDRFWLLWGSQALSLAGSFAVQFAIIWWLTSTTRIFRMFSLRQLGAFNEQRKLREQLIRDALRRGDRYTETTVRRYSNPLWLAADDMVGAATTTYSLGMDHVRYDYCYPLWGMDLSHPLFGMDHNRCILCARCVRTCWHIEGAGTRNLAGRGSGANIITDMGEDWGVSATCTSCGKCVQSCPTGALFQIGVTAGEMTRDPSRLNDIITARRKKEWNV